MLDIVKQVAQLQQRDRATLAQLRAVLTNKRNVLPVCDSKLSKRRAVSLL